MKRIPFYIAPDTHAKRERERKKLKQRKEGGQLRCILLFEMMETQNKANDIMRFLSNCAISKNKKRTRENMRMSIILENEEKNCPEYVPRRETHSTKQKRKKRKERKTCMYVYKCTY
jgi:hypothetical protein